MEQVFFVKADIRFEKIGIKGNIEFLSAHARYSRQWLFAP